MPQLVQLEVAPDQERIRADKLLVELLAAAGHKVTRNEIQRWIVEGKVQADGAPMTQKRATLAAGSKLVVELAPPLQSEASPDPSVIIEVVHEDAHLIVVNKQAGLVVHPAKGNWQGTLVNGLLARGGFEVGSADPRDPAGHLRPGIVHRLDKGTSGLLVVAKSPAAREGLKQQFADHSIERSYLALVLGRARSASYDTPHGRHPRSRLRFTSTFDRPKDRPNRGAPASKTRRAITHVELLAVLAEGSASLVRCRLETGRTHQIRVHLLEQAGTPIVGDPLYGGPPPAGEPLQQLGKKLGRQALHAAVLGFVHPITSERLRWQIPPPQDMTEALADLGWVPPTKRST